MSEGSGAVTMALVDLRRGTANKYSWRPPFDSTIAYENERWWDHAPYFAEDPWYVQVLEAGVEVARVELDDLGGINPEYTDVPALGPERLEIQFIEVATAARGRGVGTRVMRGLEQRHANRRLFAYSEEADGFWTSLGWDRFDHPDGSHRALYIRTAR